MALTALWSALYAAGKLPRPPFAAGESLLGEATPLIALSPRGCLATPPMLLLLIDLRRGDATMLCNDRLAWDVMDIDVKVRVNVNSRIVQRSTLARPFLSRSRHSSSVPPFRPGRGCTFGTRHPRVSFGTEGTHS